MDDNLSSVSSAITVTSADIDGLRRAFSGPIVVEGDPGYEDARRVWNGMIDRRPAIVAQAASVSDIAPALLFARKLALPIAVRGGGHNVAGNGTVDGGLVLDLSRLRGIRVDRESRTVRVEAGTTLADLDQATQPHRLAVPVGVVSATGVAGLTLGGGIGWLTRCYGLTVDNLVSAEIVTASGHRVRASRAENSELFWAIRGGGGNFGVVSSFTFRAYDIPERVLSGNFIYGPDRWHEALRAYEIWTQDLPDEITSIVSFLVPPPEWGMGEGPLMIFGFAWATADVDQGERVVDRLRRAAPPDAEVVEPKPWATWQTAADTLFPKGVRGYWKNTSFDRLDDDVIATIVRRASEQTWYGTGFDIHHLGGAYGRVGEDATPFPNRSARFWLNIYGFWPNSEDDRPRTRFVRGFAEDMEPFSSGGRYVNFLGAEPDSDRHQQALDVYGPEKLERLTAIKREWDPENLFRLNHNIPPR